jgi:UDP-N-acetylmuramyl pentapeptide phosphotransferase/UDP-N-acetylglucosamine-1-phosphate transferase
MPRMLAGMAAVSFIVALLIVRVLLSRFARIALDQPNARSLHRRAVPRTGGIAVLAGAAVSLAFGAASLWLPLLLALLLAAVSLGDDLRGLPRGVRLAAHFAAAGVLVWQLADTLHPGMLVLAALAVAWVTNLYNFMDGSDGLAAGMALIGFGAYGVAAHASAEWPLAALCLALAAAAAGFLVYNFHPARLFLGDVGSIPLGFLAAALGLLGWRRELWPLWFPLLVFGPFIGDATATLARRLVRREPVWQAHREHYYQRIVRMGLGHRGAAWICYAAMAVCAVAALAGRNQAAPQQAAAFAAGTALLAALAIWVDVRWARHPASRRESGPT